MRANGRINSVTPYENELMKAYCTLETFHPYQKHYIVASVLIVGLVLKLITDNHDLQYRHRWKPDDIVIWDKYADPVSLILFWMQANRRVQPHCPPCWYIVSFLFKEYNNMGVGSLT